MASILEDYVRDYDETKDSELIKFSYSKIDTYKQCPYRYDLKYNQHKSTKDTTLALQLGTLLHYVLEQKGRMIVSGKRVDYGKLSDILQNGTEQLDDKTQDPILGIKALKGKYWETWGVQDTEGRTYEEKLEFFLKVLSDEMEDSEWQPYLFEHPFTFVYKDRAVISGFIDRVDKLKNGEVYRVIDYKTNKKEYDPKSLPTSMQFGIYAMAMLNEFKQLPEESIYRLILIDKTQKALTLGWEKRLVTALDKVLDSIDSGYENKEWIPKPTPLCHWCNYCKTNPDAKDYKYECKYYSLWTPAQKTFEVNMKWGDPVTERKLIF